MSHVDTVRELLRLYEAQNVPAAMKLFAKDAVYQFGNLPPAHGIEQIEQGDISRQLASVKRVTFDIKEMIEPGDGVVVCELEAAYETADGRRVALPCANVFRFGQGGLIEELKAFLDPTPLFARPAAV